MPKKTRNGKDDFMHKFHTERYYVAELEKRELFLLSKVAEILNIFDCNSQSLAA